MDSEITTNDTQTNDTQTNDIEIIDPRSDDYTQDKYVDVLDPYANYQSFFKVEDIEKEQERSNLRNMTFNEWNRSQDPWNRILHPVTFDINAFQDGEIEFGELKKNVQYNIGSKSGNYNFMPMMKKGKKGGGITLSLPSVISQRGYCRLNEEVGKCVPFVMDMNNPHHRHFLYYVYPSFLKIVVEKIMENPGDFKSTMQSLRNPSAQRGTQDYTLTYFGIYSAIKHFFRFPKNGSETDNSSNLRMCFFNPIDRPKTEKSAGFTTTVKVLMKGKIKEISLKTLERICEGWDTKDGKLVKGEPKGIEFSGHINFGRITGSGSVGLKVTGTYIEITDIFPAKRGEREAERHAQETLKLINTNKTFDSILGIDNFKDAFQEEEEEKTSFEMKPKDNQRNPSPVKDRREEEDERRSGRYRERSERAERSERGDRRDRRREQSNRDVDSIYTRREDEQSVVRRGREEQSVLTRGRAGVLDFYEEETDDQSAYNSQTEDDRSIFDRRKR